MMTPSAFFFTIVELGVPAFLRVVWYGVLLKDACAPPTKSTTGPSAMRPMTERAKERLRRGDVTPFLLQQEQGRVEPDPYDVDEVPVVTHALERGQLTRIAFTAAHAKQQEGHGDDAQDDVQTVKTGGDEEDRAVGVGVPTRGQVRPLVGLVGHEQGAHDHRDDDPASSFGAPAMFDEPHGPLHRERRGNQDDGEDPRLQYVEVGADGGPRRQVGADRK